MDLDPDVSPRSAPVAPVASARRELHGIAWTDDYAWMSEHDSEELAAYLRAEREFYDASTRHLVDLTHALYAEMEQRTVATDDSVAWRRGDFLYYTRTVAGSEYEQFLSTRDLADIATVILDEAELAAKLADVDGFVEIGVREVSPDGTLLAYSVDTAGDEVYALRFRRLRPGRDHSVADDLDEVVARSYYGGAWSADSSTFFYTVHDEAYRPYQVWRHRIGTPVADDTLVFTEDDARYEVEVSTTTSREFVVVHSACRDTDETWLIPAADPTATPRLVRARERGVEYRVDHSGGELFIVTNDGAVEYRLMTTTLDSPHWMELAPSRPGERLHAAHALDHYVVLELRRDGFGLLRILDRRTGTEREVHSGLPAGRLALHPEIEPDAESIVISVDSLVDPPVWYAVDLATGDRTVRKIQSPPGHDPSRYVTERRHVPAPDGTPVPVTLARHRDTPLDGTAPCLLWGYGAYESCDDPEFSEALPSLLDRGVVYALAHPRGGGERGRQWWLAGRLEAKPTTFTDYLAVADWLGASLVDPARIATRGLSAGGLLQGAMLSMRPDRWRAIVAEVPFVDVVNTMLDPSIPLTINEWDEWGDPRVESQFAVLRSYSPYDNVPVGVRRPALLVTAAVHDPRVMVHEPAKWVARLRATAGPHDGDLLLRVELGAGAHTGPAGRYAHHRYEAEVLAFLLHHLAPTTPVPP